VFDLTGRYEQLSLPLRKLNVWRICDEVYLYIALPGRFGANICRRGIHSECFVFNQDVEQAVLKLLGFSRGRKKLYGRHCDHLRSFLSLVLCIKFLPTQLSPISSQALVKELYTFQMDA
jgi:hypothetical protein